MPASRPSLKLVKSFTYRGATRNFSNRYYVNGGTPADTAHWTTFSDAVVAAEKATYLAALGTQIVAAYGYAAGSDVPVFTKTYAVTGTGAWTGYAGTPGDAAALIRYSTTARTSKNHPIYLYNYYHAATVPSGGPYDTLHASQRTAMQTYAAAWITGFSDGTNTLVRCGPNGATATGSLVETLVTHRDLPRA